MVLLLRARPAGPAFCLFIFWHILRVLVSGLKGVLVAPEEEAFFHHPGTSTVAEAFAPFYLRSKLRLVFHCVLP